jgi:hypothetical protein
VTEPGADQPGEPIEQADPAAPGLDVILGEIEQVVEPVTESVSMAPAVGP